jgi:hypothetical protein
MLLQLDQGRMVMVPYLDRQVHTDSSTSKSRRTRQRGRRYSIRFGDCVGALLVPGVFAMVIPVAAFIQIFKDLGLFAFALAGTVPLSVMTQHFALLERES